MERHFTLDKALMAALSAEPLPTGSCVPSPPLVSWPFSYNHFLNYHLFKVTEYRLIPTHSE